MQYQVSGAGICSLHYAVFEGIDYIEKAQPFKILRVSRVKALYTVILQGYRQNGIEDAGGRKIVLAPKGIQIGQHRRLPGTSKPPGTPCVPGYRLSCLLRGQRFFE